MILLLVTKKPSKRLRFIALVCVTHLVAQVLCGVQTLLVLLRGCGVYYTGLGLNVNRDNTRLTRYQEQIYSVCNATENNAGKYTHSRTHCNIQPTDTENTEYTHSKLVFCVDYIEEQ